MQKDFKASAGSPVDIAELTAKAHKSGNPIDQFQVAQYHFNEYEDPTRKTDLKTASDYATAAAHKKYVPAMTLLAVIYDQMMNEETDPKKKETHSGYAKAWAYQAAYHGCPDGQRMAIGYSIEEGDPVRAMLFAQHALNNPANDIANKSTISEMLGDMLGKKEMLAQVINAMDPKYQKLAHDMGDKIARNQVEATRGTQPLPSGQEPDAGCP